MKIDRPGAAIIGAVLMVAFRIVGPNEALQSIDFPTIVLLFSMMVVVANLRLGGFFEHIARVDCRATPPASRAPDGYLYLRVSVRVSRQRHRLPGHDSVRAADDATTSVTRSTGDCWCSSWGSSSSWRARIARD